MIPTMKRSDVSRWACAALLLAGAATLPVQLALAATKKATSPTGKNLDSTSVLKVAPV